jgi:hypothetical protein
MEIVVKGADFSALGLGNTRWIEKFIKTQNITNTTYVSALRKMYSVLSAAGTDKKLEVLRLFFSGSAALNALNILDISKNILIFTTQNPSAHTTSGWQPSGNHWGISDYKPSDVSNFHMHVWNSTMETNTNGALLGLFVGKTAANSVKLSLARGYNNPSGSETRGALGAQDALESKAGQNYDRNQTGLLSAARVGDVLKIYDKGNVIVNVIKPYTGYVDGTLNIQEGNFFPSTSAYTTNAKLLCTAYGKGQWTDADEVILYNAISVFKSTLGI